VDANLVRASKRLAKALRHNPAGVGLVLDREGWAAVSEVLTALDMSRQTLDAVVAGNDKQRFAVARGDDGVDRIRASQGHSIAVDLGLEPVDPPPVLFHGTPAPNVDSIMATGLRPGRRQYVHLSADRATAEDVGRRRRLPVAVLMVDCLAMAAAGHMFYRSANGVWLTDQVPPDYLTDAGAGPR
jgi:putative RNA 2'-phosphotransferase